MLDDWMSVLESGKYETLLRDLTISRPGGEMHRGVGLLTWGEDDGVDFVAETEHDGDPFSLVSPFQLGQIIPAKEQYRLTATVPSGWHLETSAFVTSPSIDFAGGLSTWTHKCRALTLSRPLNSDFKPSLLALVKPLKQFVYPKLSEIHDDNPYFGRTRKLSDWFEHEGSFGRVVVRRSGAESALVLIKGEIDQDQFETALESVRLAFSFVEGRSVQVVGYQALACNEQRRRIYPKLSTTEGTFVPVLMAMYGGGREPYGPLLCRAIDFFHTETEKAYSDQLRMCWAMSDSYASQRAFAACAAVESLVQKVNQVSPELGSKEIRAQEVIRRYLSNPRKKLDQSFVHRIDSFFAAMKRSTPKDILQGWSESGFLGTEEADLKAWGELRNRVSHGHLHFHVPEKEFPELSRRFKSLARVQNMVNKLVLLAMGYEGYYFDYAKYMPSTFPPHKNRGIRPDDA
jgi:hypothetical protein